MVLTAIIPRASDLMAGKELLVEATTLTTITVNAGASPRGQQYEHRWVVTTNAVQEESITRLGGRSSYIQNVTTFGTGAVGQKIDGDLHAGGNDSYGNQNDFTQVINDGIGAWITNLGRAELKRSEPILRTHWLPSRNRWKNTCYKR